MLSLTFNNSSNRSCYHLSGRDHIQLATRYKILQGLCHLALTIFLQSRHFHDPLFPDKKAKALKDSSWLPNITQLTQRQDQHASPGRLTLVPRLEPGQSTTLKITGYASDLSKVRTRPRILMITNDPDHAKVIVNIHISNLRLKE